MSGPMGLVYETPGDPSTSDVWGVALNASLVLIEQHDHTSGKGAQVPSAGIGINADLSFASFALTFAKTISFVPVAASTMTSYVNAFYVNSADSNLWFRNSSGTPVQILAGSQLNLAAIGGILGDYSSVSASFSYEDSTRRYLAQQELVGGLRPWAGFATGDIDLYQKAVSISNKVTLKSPNALAASYSMTFPAAAAAGNAQLLTVDSAGQIRNDGIVGNNTNVKLQGTGYVQRGLRTRSLPFMATGMWNFGSGSLPGYTSAGTTSAVTLAPGTYYYPIILNDDNERLQSLTVYLTALTNNCALALYTASNSAIGATFVPVTGATGSAALGGITRTVVLTPTSPAVAPNTVYWVQFVVPAGGSANLFLQAVTTDVP